jgi:hypothetical protein
LIVWGQNPSSEQNPVPEQLPSLAKETFFVFNLVEFFNHRLAGEKRRQNHVENHIHHNIRIAVKMIIQRRFFIRRSQKTEPKLHVGKPSDEAVGAEILKNFETVAENLVRFLDHEARWFFNHLISRIIDQFDALLIFLFAGIEVLVFNIRFKMSKLMFLKARIGNSQKKTQNIDENQ